MGFIILCALCVIAFELFYIMCQIDSFMKSHKASTLDKWADEGLPDTSNKKGG